MKNAKLKVNNVKAFILFAIIIAVIIGLFVFFIFRFNKLDDNKYPITVGSVFYSDDYNYLTVEAESYLAQKFDGNYYWYQKENNKTVAAKVGANPVVFNKSDYKVYLYGSAFEVKSNGDIVNLSGVTEITKSSPTKFYKLRDRKYLMVDSNLRTDDQSIKTTGYLIIELDKQGNATFANNELNIKTIKPLILKGTTMSFDIANEKLIHDKNEINLKNIIGSTNLYKEPEEEVSTETEGGSGGGGAYYDEYVRDVVYSVNNLTKSVTEVNDKTDTSVKKGEIYYDFSKYIALKSISSSVSTITINYTVVDSNNEYQNVFVTVDDNEGNSNKYFLNKNEASYIIRDLRVDHNYTISFGYKLTSADDDIVEDVVNVKTKSPTCQISVSKVSGNKLTYNIQIGSEYKFDYGEMHLYVDGIAASSEAVNMSAAANNGGYTGVLTFTRLGNVNTLKLENVVYNGSGIAIDCSYRFVS